VENLTVIFDEKKHDKHFNRKERKGKGSITSKNQGRKDIHFMDV